LNNKAPWGLTELDALRLALPSPEESELYQYKQDEHNCRIHANDLAACRYAADEKADLTDKASRLTAPIK
jgi:hypothetical protein